MVSYNDLVTMLEDAWSSYGLHEHVLTESIIPETHDRVFRVELFPEHDDPLTDENMPPWVDVQFTWSATHQLHSEGRDIENEPFLLTWIYMVFVQGAMCERSDQELTHLFYQAIQKALQSFLPDTTQDPIQMGIEVRRIYQTEHDVSRLAYVQLVSTNITDISEQLNDPDPRCIQQIIHLEVQLVSTVINSLAATFRPGGRGGYRTAQTA